MRGVLSLGSVNADFQMRVGTAPQGPGTLLGRDLLRTSGGKAANVAVLVQNLGAGTRLLGCTGDDDLAGQALAGPRDAGVDVARVRRASGMTGVSAIFVEPGGDKTIVLAPNANDAWPDDDPVDDEVADMSSDSVLVADMEVPVAVVDRAVRASRNRGLTVVLDPSPTDRVPDDLLPMVDHLTPDHREAQELTGIDASGEEGAMSAAEALREAGTSAAYVKMDSGGCAVVTADRRVVVPGPPGVDVIDKTGAGDAFAGGLAWALLAGCDPVDGAATAVAAAACAVTRYGSQQSYPEPAALEEMTARVVKAGGGRLAGG
ncbi:MAG TPA: PfkB family carbohydrate kinase [Acidimicrobiales bacterium]|nr:PfkB family carbohydrate kinase [Acidimicrobiales bacterium]